GIPRRRLRGEATRRYERAGAGTREGAARSCCGFLAQGAGAAPRRAWAGSGKNRRPAVLVSRSPRRPQDLITRPKFLFYVGRTDLTLNSRPAKAKNGSAATARSAKQLSLPFDVRGLDDRPPFLGIGLLQCVERLRCLLLARKNFHPKLDEPRAHSLIG